jgi:hypothetical protein
MPKTTLFMRNTKWCRYLNNISFKMVFLRNNTLLPAIANVLETFLEAVL